MTGLHFFWAWLLKYASLLATALGSVFAAWCVDRFVTRRPKLVSYTSHTIRVGVPTPDGQPGPPVATFSLFLWNEGKAPAREVHVGHYAPRLPAYNVFPDIPREVVNTLGGGTAIRFGLIPAQTLVTISYLIAGESNVENVISYIGSEDGYAHHIPVRLQRVYTKWTIRAAALLMFLGGWVLLNGAISLIRYLWITFYK